MRLPAAIRVEHLKVDLVAHRADGLEVLPGKIGQVPRSWRPPHRRDIVRRNGETGLVFLGRADDQVKVRGFRVEPGEVEAVLASCADVRHAAVTVHEYRPGDKRLVAYYVPAEGAAIEPEALRRLSADRLSDYLVPADFVCVAELPVT